MKQLFTFLLVAISSVLLAQAPQSIPYQAVVRNTDGTVMASTTITMTFKIHDVAAAGTVVYEETHSTSSNTQGLVSLNVGAGTAVTGTFAGINWGSGAKFLHVLMNTGSGNVDLGTQQMMSVPYALYAAKSGEIDSSSSLQLGQSHAGGKIFYIDESGKHGLVFAELQNYPTLTRNVNHVYGSFIGAGRINTKTHLQNINPFSSNPEDAVIFCDTLNFNNYDDWFLPSSYELLNIIDQNLFLFEGTFLSSTDQFSSSTYGSTSLQLFDARVMVVKQNIQYSNSTRIFADFFVSNCYNVNCPTSHYYGKVIPIRFF